MLNYFEFLIKDLPLGDIALTQIKDLFLVDATAYKVLINTLLDTEVKAFVTHLVDYKLEPYTSDIQTSLDIVALDQQLARFTGCIPIPELQNIAMNHFSPIWRVAAFVAGYILEADRIYNKNADISYPS
jgi:hypothetical protein